MFNLSVLVTVQVLMLAAVDVHNVKPKLETGEEREKKCLRRYDLDLKLSDTCLTGQEDKLSLFSSFQNGVMEKSAEVCSIYDDPKHSLMEPVDMDLDSSPESLGDRTDKKKAEIKKDLDWIRWTEYSTYAKGIINSNKWESIQSELITVVTYNVLSQILLEKHRYLYKWHDNVSLRWDTRSEILLEEFSNFNADILCLQEVDSCLLNSFYNKNLNEMGYQGVYKQKTNDKVDGCAIYFKKARFNLVKDSTVEMYKEAVHLLDRDNIGIILKLSLKSNPEAEFVVATTHLLYNPRRGDIRLAQTQLMLAEIEKLAYKKHSPMTQQPEYLPIIFTGDMNYSPDNGIYQLVTKSFLEYEGTSREKLVPSSRGQTLNKTLLPPGIGVTDSCQYASSLSNREGVNSVNFSTGVLDHHLNLESVYDHVKGNLPEATTNQKTWVTVDYIFYSQSWDEKLKARTDRNLKLVSRLTLPNSKEAEVYLKRLPNSACASDHLPLMATFQLIQPLKLPTRFFPCIATPSDGIGKATPVTMIDYQYQNNSNQKLTECFRFVNPRLTASLNSQLERRESFDASNVSSSSGEMLKFLWTRIIGDSLPPRRKEIGKTGKMSLNLPRTSPADLMSDDVILEQCELS